MICMHAYQAKIPQPRKEFQELSAPLL